MNKLIISLLCIIIILQIARMPTSQEPSKAVTWANPVKVVHQPVIETPEFRPPPVKEYKPRRFQQMGLLKNTEGDILPLYGKETPGHSNRYHYYTSTTGNQVYSLPIKHKDRDCLDDIGCEEFLGSADDIQVEGMEGTFNASVFRNNYALL